MCAAGMLNLFWLDIGYIHLYLGWFGWCYHCYSERLRFRDLVGLDWRLESAGGGGWTSLSIRFAQVGSFAGKPKMQFAIIIASWSWTYTRRTVVAVIGPFGSFDFDAKIACPVWLEVSHAVMGGRLKIGLFVVSADCCARSFGSSSNTGWW